MEEWPYEQLYKYSYNKEKEVVLMYTMYYIIIYTLLWSKMFEHAT